MPILLSRDPHIYLASVLFAIPVCVWMLTKYGKKIDEIHRELHSSKETPCDIAEPHITFAILLMEEIGF